MKTIINENQRGLLFRNGRFVKALETGKYHTFGNQNIEGLLLGEPVKSANCSLEILLKNDELAKKVDVIDVEDEKLALMYVDGRFMDILKPGKHAFWKEAGNHEFRVVSTAEPMVSDDVPVRVFNKIVAYRYLTQVDVAEYQKGRLFYDGKFVKLLEPGTYYFWKDSRNVEVSLVDTRLMQKDIAGQEILTKDKVTLRINFVCNYRITDYVKVLTEVDDFENQLHVAAQLALREYVGQYRIDEILENKEQIAEFVLEKLKKKGKELYLDVTDVGIKDIILPGEIRDIMNTVLVAEKRAQANVITRREEVASTRSLLNTAKLMDENQTLYKLKELEYLERICENVGNITVNGNSDLLAQLGSILSPKQA